MVMDILVCDVLIAQNPAPCSWLFIMGNTLHCTENYVLRYCLFRLEGKLLIENVSKEALNAGVQSNGSIFDQTV
jgi:hypothetical protein